MKRIPLKPLATAAAIVAAVAATNIRGRTYERDWACLTGGVCKLAACSTPWACRRRRSTDCVSTTAVRQDSQSSKCTSNAS